MSKNLDLVAVLKSAGFSKSKIDDIMLRVSTIDEADDIISIITSMPSMSRVGIMHHVENVLNGYKGEKYETIYF